MANKYYAVKEGRKTGIFHTWDACKAQVHGYTGATYKSFKNRQDAEAYLKGETGSGSYEKTSHTEPVEPGPDVAVAYVDGSYHPGLHAYSCGAVLFYEGEKIEFSQRYDDPEMADMRNVAGEIMGAVSVINYCIQNGIKNLVVYHDYEGVAKWANGDWKANKPGTQAYAKTCTEAREKLALSFVKVKGHSGDRYNDEADILAKKALGLA